MNRNCRMYAFALGAIACLFTLSLMAASAAPEFQITFPKANGVVAGEVMEIRGVGAEPAGTIEVEVLTDRWYVQTGTARTNADGSWSYSPVHLAGQGVYNNHTVRATIIKNGRRDKSVSITGVVRKQ